MARPTILQIVPELETGGAELSAVEIATAVVQAGGRALVLSEGGRLVARLESAGGEFVPFAAASKNPIRMLWNARMLGKLIEREDVSLIHARSRAPAWSAMLAARRAGKPFVTTVHGAHSERSAMKKRYNSIMARGDVVITNSQFTAAIVKDRYGVADQRLRVIYRGIDPSQFDPADVSDERLAALRAKWDVPAGARIILLPARLSPIKGHRTVVEAIARLKQQQELGDTVVVFAGDAQGRDGYVAELNHLIDVAGLTASFRLPGHVADVPAAMLLADATLVASTVPETFGRTVAEAGAMNCPVIATDIGAPPELIVTAPSSERTGWLTPPGDPARLADAIREVVALSPAARLTLGEAARRHVLQRFSLRAMKQQTLAVYDTLLGSGLEAAFTKAVPER